MADEVKPDAAPQAPAPVANDDMLVEVVVDGKKVQEPVSKLRASYQIQSAAEARLNAAKQYQQEYRAQVELSNRLENLLQTRGPEAAVEEFQRIAERAAGRPVKRSEAQQQSTDVDTPADPNTTGLQRELQEVKDQLQELTGFKRSITTERAAAKIRSDLAQYPVYREDPELLERAATVVGAMKVAFPDRPEDQVIAEIHAQDQALITRQLKQVHDNRLARAGVTRAVNPQLGTPAMTDFKPPTYEDFKKGTWSEKVAEFTRKFVGQDTLNGT